MLDTANLKEVLQLLSEYGVEEFKTNDFSVKFKGAEPGFETPVLDWSAAQFEAPAEKE